MKFSETRPLLVLGKLCCTLLCSVGGFLLSIGWCNAVWPEAHHRASLSITSYRQRMAPELSGSCCVFQASGAPTAEKKKRNIK